MYCGGREHHHDELTRRAQGRVVWMDTGAPGADAATVRELLRRQMAAFCPDRVVVCDAPLGGPLLEATLCAVEDGIPVVLIDNLYNPHFPLYFCGMHGPVADGIVLTGLSSCYTEYGPSYLAQVPPLLDLDAPGAQAFLGRVTRPLLTVLAYDPRALSLGLNVATALGSEVTPLFVSPDPESVRLRVGPYARVVAPPDDAVLSGVLQRSALVVGKCGFLQLTECLALGTPFMGLFYDTYYNPSDLPAPCQEMLHITSSAAAAPDTVEGARRLLSGQFPSAGAVHDGGSGGIDRTVAWLETMPSAPRAGCLEETGWHGFTPERVCQALGVVGPVEMLRCTMVRNEPEGLIFVVTCRVAGECHRLWGRRYPNREAFREAVGEGRFLGAWEDDLMALEQDRQFHRLPPLGLAEPTV